MPAFTTIRAANGAFCSAHDGGGGSGAVTVDRPEAREWEWFRMYRLENSRVAFASYKHYFLKAEGGGGGLISATAPTRDAWETYVQVTHEDGRVSLMAASGQFVTVDDAHRLVASAWRCGEREKFVLANGPLVR